MTENNNADARKRHISTPNPAVEGETGQYAEGDYGEAGTVETGAAARGGDEYAEGDYGEAGTVDTGAAARGGGEYAEGDYGEGGTAHQGDIATSQPNDHPEDHDAAAGRTDDDTEGAAGRD
ncbi:hypothetical protein [Arthrobacter sp. NPDC093139]|uniref:hypothetical protein n=1 Tax=Arthrobacter sp. NPDC093139 TaxID=3363945 RepID=UPI0038110EE6